jgi:hypothetical protein
MNGISGNGSEKLNLFNHNSNATSHASVLIGEAEYKNAALHESVDELRYIKNTTPIDTAAIDHSIPRRFPKDDCGVD